MSAQGTHGPIAEEYAARMKALAVSLDKVFNGDKKGHERTVGFALFVFEFGLTGKPERDRINYISNSDRRDMIVAMKEWIARAEGRHIEEQGGQPGNA